ncbi:MAG: hypothetical protein LBV04_08825 [Deferribacteraceae bacterium]|jgi:hypothetical protein|nr:hypothetical protein [Deferribacteraceae bacterium]
MYAMLTVTIGNSIYWRYASFEPSAGFASGNITLNVKWFTASQLKKATDIIMEYKNDDDDTIMRRLSFVSEQANDSFVFRLQQASTISDEAEKHIMLEYEDTLLLKFIESDDKGLYVQRVTRENNASAGSLAVRMRKAINTEPPESRNILRFMLELNNKLDDILNLVSIRKEEGSRPMRTVGISAAGFVLHDEELIPDGALAYTHCTVGDGEDRTIMSALLEVKQLKAAETGFFYMARFIHLKDDLIDGIVKYLFSRERDMIKGIRDL